MTAPSPVLVPPRRRVVSADRELCSQSPPPRRPVAYGEVLLVDSETFVTLRRAAEKEREEREREREREKERERKRERERGREREKERERKREREREREREGEREREREGGELQVGGADDASNDRCMTDLSDCNTYQHPTGDTPITCQHWIGGGIAEVGDGQNELEPSILMR